MRLSSEKFNYSRNREDSDKFYFTVTLVDGLWVKHENSLFNYTRERKREKDEFIKSKFPNSVKTNKSSFTCIKNILNKSYILYRII